MNRPFTVALCLLLSSPISFAQSKTQEPLRFDLSKIGMVINGEQMCNDTNPRLQDIPSPTMEQIMAGGPRSVPVLIEMLGDRRMAQTKEPIICYWPDMTIGDISFCLLTTLFMDPRGNTTVPGTSWNDMLGRHDRPAWDQLHWFIKKNGAVALQTKWRRVWARYSRATEWDIKERCFKLKISK